MIVNTDIDIDVANRSRLLTVVNNTPAMIERDGKKVKHNTGVYFHEVPENPFTGMCEVDYKKAEEIGYFKIDVLNVNIYDGIQTKAELDELLSMEPMWELLDHEEVVSQCFHIHGHFEVVKRMRPRSLPQLAAVLAMIRPAKRHLLGRDWDTVFANVWDRPDDDAYFFKKAHAHAYAQAIVLQLNQIVKRSYAQG